MKMERKEFEFKIDSLTEEGQFSGYLSTFGNVDAGGDVVERGAFKRTLKQNKAFPLIIQHDHVPIPSLAVGSFRGEEDTKGLKIDGEFYLDIDEGKKAYMGARRLKEDKVRVGLSMGYKTIKKEDDEIDGVPVRRLREIKLYEGSLTLFPMNEEALIEAVKSDYGKETEAKPYPNEHACRLKDPGQYTRFVRMKRKHDGKEYSVIIGLKKGGGSEDQAYRYPKKTWSASEARSHCKEHDGTFEAAKKDNQFEIICKSCLKTLGFDDPEKSTRKSDPSKKADSDKFHSALKKIADNIKKS